MRQIAKKSWSVKDARSRFSDLLDAAERGEPQHISRRGKGSFVIIRESDWHTKDKEQAGNDGFVEHLMAFPGGIELAPQYRGNNERPVPTLVTTMRRTLDHRRYRCHLACRFAKTVPDARLASWLMDKANGTLPFGSITA